VSGGDGMDISSQVAVARLTWEPVVASCLALYVHAVRGCPVSRVTCPPLRPSGMASGVPGRC
jgi:hypothetical protein